jgi:hypothetical protein
LNLIFAYVINIRLFAHFLIRRIADFHFSFNIRIKPRFITVAYCNCKFVEVIDIDKTISDHKATQLYLRIPDVIHKSYQRLVWIYKKGDVVKFNNLISQFDWYKLLSNCKIYNCIISLRTCFFSCNKSTFRSPVTTTCWVKLNDYSIEC